MELKEGFVWTNHDSKPYQRKINILGFLFFVFFLFLRSLNRKIKLQMKILKINCRSIKVEDPSMEIFHLHLNYYLITITEIIRTFLINKYTFLTTQILASKECYLIKRIREKYLWVHTDIKKWLNKWLNGIKDASLSYRRILSCIYRYSLL